MNTSKAEAVRLGLEFYCTGRPCINGNIVPRSVKHGQCLCDACKQKRAKSSSEWRSENRQRVRDLERERRNTPHRKEKQARADYERRMADPEKLAAAKKAWYEKNRKRILEKKKADRESRRDEYRAWRKKHYAKTRDAQIAKVKKWQDENPDYAHRYRSERRGLLAERSSSYRISRNIATPAWAEPFKILAFYEAARNLTVGTGILHSVDHIVPLRSDLVCGLHCPDNLRVIPQADNVSKGNYEWPDMP